MLCIYFSAGSQERKVTLRKSEKKGTFIVELGKLFVFIAQPYHTAFISKIHLVMAGPDRSISIHESGMYGCAMNTNSFPNSTMNVPYFSLLRDVTFRSCEPAKFHNYVYCQLFK